MTETFQGTDPSEFRRARQWVRDNASALREAEDENDDGPRLAPEFRELLKIVKSV